MLDELRWTLRSLVIGALLIPEYRQCGMAFNPLSDRIIRNPYPAYARLRALSPVHRSRVLDGWMFSRYADVEAIFRDYRRFSNMPTNRRVSRQDVYFIPPRADWSLLFHDPPEHTRLRGLVNQAFTPRAVNALEPHIRRVMVELLDAVGDPSGFDLMAAVAGPLPVIVIAEMLGLPPQDRLRFKHWSNQRARILEPLISSDERKRATAGGEAFDAYFMPIIRARRLQPKDDIISALAKAEEEGDSLTEREMLIMLRLLLVAGNETTTNLIGNGMLALLQHPEQLKLLREDARRIPGAVEELLRYDTPVQLDIRARGRRLRVSGLSVASRRSRHPGNRCGQPRPGSVRRPGAAEHRAFQGQQPLLRPGHPPLPRCPPGAVGSAGRTGSTVGTLQLHTGCLRTVPPFAGLSSCAVSSRSRSRPSLRNPIPPSLLSARGEVGLVGIT